MTTVVNESVVAADDRHSSAISWGAIFAGLVVVVATGGLLGLLGSAIGITIADASDLEAMGAGFGVGAAIWVILSFAIAYFVGGVLAGRLAGESDNNVGMLHGVTLWGLASLLSIWLGFAGITSVVQTGASAVSGAVSGVASSVTEAGSAAIAGGEGLASAADNLMDTALFDRVTASVKRSATATLAEEMAAQSDEITTGEARAAINDIDPEVLKSVGAQLLDGDLDGARNALANQTALSEGEISALVNSASETIKSEIPGSSSDETAVTAAGDYLARQISESVASADQVGGADVDSSDVREAIAELDVDTMQRVGFALVQGETERAQDILATNTSLSENQIEAIVAGAEKEAEQQIGEIKQQIDELEQTAVEAAEVASTYATGVAWALFAASALALVACVIGGRMGSETVQRLYAIRQTRTA